MPSRLPLVGLVLAAAAACTDSRGAQPPPRADLPRATDSAGAADSGRLADSTRRFADSVRATRPARRARPPALPPLADSLAQLMVFNPRGQLWFTGAARGKRMVVDVGRIDADVRKDTARMAAFQVAARHRATIPVGTRFRLHGPWGQDDATVTGYDVWNGRIVATLDVPRRVDSLARTVEPLPVAAVLSDSARAESADSCQRDSIPEELGYRAAFVRDSIQQWLRDYHTPPYERLAGQVVVRTSRIAGCFGIGRVLLIVSLRAGATEYVSERAAVLDDTGHVAPLKGIHDFRFRAHDAVYALDADGDGVDDVAARGAAEAMGGIAILRLDTLERRLTRLSSGFSWEAR